MTKTGGRSRPVDFEALVRPHVDYLYRLAFRFTGSREEAEDLVQDLLVKLYPRRDEVAEVARLRPWLTRVLYRQFVDRDRKRSRQRLLDPRGADDEEGDDPFDRMASDAPNAEAAASAAFTSQQLEWALGQLSRDHRAVVALHDMEGYTLVEIADALEVPTGTLKSRLHRARAHLRALLEAEGDHR